MAQVRAIGDPENDSERKSIQYLRDHLPDSYTIYHNLELTSPTHFPYEYDLIVVGDYAVYCIEVKGYHGRITGNAIQWHLGRGVTYPNPIPLNNKKAKILKDRILQRNPFLDFWVQPLVLLSDERTRFSLADDQSDKIHHLDSIVSYMTRPRSEGIENLHRQICDAIERQFVARTQQRQIGDYVVLETITKNNLFDTFLCEHSIIQGKRYQLKVYSFDVYARRETRDRQEDRIKRDAIALHTLPRHPNLVGAEMPFNWDSDKFVLPLEWVDGEALRSILDREQKLSLEQSLRVIRDVAVGLYHAHQYGIIHRDLTPDNIVVPEGQSIRLINFDNARLEHSDLQTIATQLDRKFDQRYVAPEVWLNAGEASVQSDIYALGIILIEALVGQTPYNRIQVCFDQQGIADFVTASEFPEGLNEIVTRMCAFKPADRYHDLNEVIEYLDIVS